LEYGRKVKFQGRYIPKSQEELEITQKLLDILDKIVNTPPTEEE
jgi:hypothetical protein